MEVQQNDPQNESDPLEATEQTEDLVNSKLASAHDSGETVKARLMTDERVFARITDGIYRDPASALRELIANGYDADATEVRVETDFPRFSKISVRDNGRGLTKETLAHVICHIGGSLKRTKQGQNFNISSDDDPTKSKEGRPLIGKLGIGLFSVSQITHHVVIISKTKGSSKRIYCDILLMPQSEALLEKEEGQKFVTGEVEIKFVEANDIDSHGTEILLLDLRSHVKEALLSKMTWDALREKDESEKKEEEVKTEADLAIAFGDDGFEGGISIVEPLFHIGEIDVHNGVILKEAKLPWKSDANSEDKFPQLVERLSAAVDPTDRSSKGPSIQEHLDYYLRMLWVLSLSIPLPYLKKHPFEIESTDGAQIFQIDNKQKGSPAEVKLDSGQTIAAKYKFKSIQAHSLPFNVFVDGIKLTRPLQYGNFKPLDHAITNPLIFIGRAKPDLSVIPEQYRGGELEFEAYLYWTKKIVPKEHNGVLIRINGASGTLFDETFLKYQVSELTRLRQITAEIFVIKGLDAALNIDRESFNIAHPHFQILKNWLHSAMRQLMNKHKLLSGNINKTTLGERKEKTFEQLRSIVSEHVKISGETASAPKSIRYLETESATLKFEEETHSKSVIELNREKALAPILRNKAASPRDKARQMLNEEKAKTLASILTVYGIDQHLSKERFESLVSAILEVMVLEIGK
ncbi:ATP-binding protein [Pseudomonas sp. CAN2814]|uniref:ATP-binding protein n=1 Tax=Pseudomonas sp. CAN1 TaxID=3046726 RepID=UPI00264A07B2|nr:ATP-binding protein [Pseudomonas sp. CAN1]MDN6856648.1 ATP-binding protein [Pseudomonas sp. CAN1]